MRKSSNFEANSSIYIDRRDVVDEPDEDSDDDVAADDKVTRTNPLV